MNWKRFGLFSAIGIVYVWLIVHAGYVQDAGLAVAYGVPVFRIALAPHLNVLFNQAIFSLLIFNQSRISFYNQGILILTRHRSRVRLLVSVIRQCCGQIMLLESLLLATNYLITQSFAIEYIPFALVQLLGLIISAIIQIIVELKVGSTEALAGVLLTLMMLEVCLPNSLQIIHPCRMSMSITAIIFLEIIVGFFLTVIGAIVMSKQEVL